LVVEPVVVDVRRTSLPLAEADTGLELLLLIASARAVAIDEEVSDRLLKPAPPTVVPFTVTVTPPES
jgi:hypothetical protein